MTSNPFQLEGLNCERFEVVKTKRKKSVAIQVSRDRVRVIAPQHLSDNSIVDIVQQKLSWIKSKLALQAQRAPVKQKVYADGEPFLYLGTTYPLKVEVDGTRWGKNTRIEDNFLVVSLPKPPAPERAAGTIQRRIHLWYIERASSYLAEVTYRWAEKIGVSPAAIKVKNYRARWGSCSTDAHITYNWRLVLAPPQVIEYVVVHELCHLLEHNHSPRYWQHVKKYLPNYAEYRQWLKLKGDTLLI